MIDHEEKLRFVLTATGSASFELDIASGMIYLDEACCAMFSSERKVLPLKTFLNSIHPEDRSVFLYTISTKQHPEPAIYQVQVRTLGNEPGKARRLTCKGRFFCDAQGTTQWSAGIIQDISSEPDSLQQDTAVAQQGALAIELAGLATFTSDFPDGELRTSALLSEMLTGQQSSSASRDLFVWHLHPEDNLVRIKAIETAIETGNLDYEARFVWEDSSVHWIKVLGKYTGGSDGEPGMMTGVAMDVTLNKRAGVNALRQMNERLRVKTGQLEQLNEQLSRSNQELEQYAYVASHDLQEPLRKIRVFSDKLAHLPDLVDGQKHLLDKINQSSHRMSTLIVDLLEFSRLLIPETMKADVDLHATINAVISDFEVTLDEKKAVITVGKLPVIRAVPLQMNQLFYNIMSNALKFSSSGHSPHIHICCRQLSRQEVRRYIPHPVSILSYFEIRFSDNGIGFEIQYAEQIFEAFRRLHGRTQYPGSGIGLALCRRIVANHGGSMYAESEPGKGTTMVVVLPQ